MKEMVDRRIGILGAHWRGTSRGSCRISFRLDGHPSQICGGKNANSQVGAKIPGRPSRRLEGLDDLTAPYCARLLSSSCLSPVQFDRTRQ